MHTSTIARLFAAPIFVTSALGCGPGKVAGAIRPDAPTAADALGSSGECHAVDKFGEPMVVDWKPDQRLELEVAMKDGVAVVAYDCKSFRLLKDCHVDGMYGFVGTNTKEQVVQLENADEIKANLPLSGAGIAAKIGGELSRGTSLDIALMMVGKRRTTWAAVTKEDLRGECEGATHFVRGATVGAFAMTTGSQAKVRAAVEIFGVGAEGGSESSKKIGNKDGSLESCKSAEPEASSPPSQCGALVKLELQAIGAEKPKDNVASQNSCPRGLVLTKGKCTTPKDAMPHQCFSGDLQDCTKQCNKGDVGSCNTLGAMFFHGSGAEQSPQQAFKFFKLACDQGNGNACANLSIMYDQGEGTERDPAKAFSLAKKACDDGSPDGCANLGVYYEKGVGTDKDSAKALRLFKVGCDAGSPGACFNAALSCQKGFSGSPDLVKAAEYYQKSCYGGDVRACSNVGVMYKEGQGVAKDPKRAMYFYSRTCNSKDEKYRIYGCHNIAELYKEGVGVPKNRDKALEYYRMGCKGGLKESCDEIKGLGGKP
jgi:uncharacterized protein